MEVAYATDDDTDVLPVRATVNVAVPSASFTVTLLMENEGRSSSVPPVPVPSSLMVTVAVGSVMIAPALGFESVMPKVLMPW